MSLIMFCAGNWEKTAKSKRMMDKRFDVFIFYCLSLISCFDRVAWIVKSCSIIPDITEKQAQM